jgi:hypothetical protein
MPGTDTAERLQGTTPATALIAVQLPERSARGNPLPEELNSVRAIHYLRTDRFDRHRIFASADAFAQFLELPLEGANRSLQDAVRRLFLSVRRTGGAQRPPLTATIAP